MTPFFCLCFIAMAATGAMGVVGPIWMPLAHWAKIYNLVKYIQRAVDDGYVVPRQTKDGPMMRSNKQPSGDVLTAIARYKREDRGQAPSSPLTANSQLKTQEQMRDKTGVVPEVLLQVLPDDCLATCPVTGAKFFIWPRVDRWWRTCDNAAKARRMNVNYLAQQSADAIAAAAETKTEEDIVSEGAEQERERLAAALAKSRERQAAEAAARHQRNGL
jgi:hypothetical protein